MPLLPLLLLPAAFLGREGSPLPTGNVTPAYPFQSLAPGADTLDAPAGEDLPLSGREGLEALTFESLEFDPPVPEAHEIAGVTVLHLHDPLLPLVDVQVQLAGGPGNFPRERLAAVSAFPFVLRSGGTRTRTPAAVERGLDELALQLSVSGGGGAMRFRMNALRETLEPAMSLLGKILLEPGLDSLALEVWRGQTRERIRRREDNPGSLAFSEFNRLMYGDHPVGWVLGEGDLSAERVSRGVLRRLHAVMVCRDRVLVGISGDVTWEDAEPLVRQFLDPWPQCEAPLAPLPEPAIRRGPGTFILPKAIEQSTVLLAQPSTVRQGDSREYFAARVADHLLGGSGFGSRIVERIRTAEGLAYGASSVWTTPARHEGLLGAYTATSAQTTPDALRLLREVLEAYRRIPPSESDVRRAVEEITTGYVFAFESAATIVARQMQFRAQGLPTDWLWRYWDGLEAVTARSVAEVIRTHLDPDRMTVLILGDPTRFTLGVERLGPVYELRPDGSYRPWVTPAGPLGGGLQSPP